MFSILDKGMKETDYNLERTWTESNEISGKKNTSYI